MKYILKEKKNRDNVYKHENTQIILKSIVQNIFFKKPTKLNTTLKLSTLIKSSIKIRLVNRCILTGRKNRFNRLYKFSRLIFFKLARNNSFVGLKKSVW